MFDYIAQLRRQPEPVRRKKALLVSAMSTLLIMAIWGVLLYFKINDGIFAARPEERVAVQVKKDSPGIIETFSNFFTGITDIFDTSETYENTANTYRSQ